LNKSTSLNIGIVAGEISGDSLGAGLIHSLETKVKKNLHLSGVAGPKMIEAGCTSLYDMERLAVMGLIEPLRRLPELIKMRRGLYQHFSKNKPDVFIGIDAPDFNLGLELKLRKLNIPTVHYVSPSVWAWRKKRIHKIALATDLVLTLFPFETEFYHEHNVPASFVGHPLADAIPLHPDKKAAREILNLNSDDVYVAILPGSRKNEVHYLAEVFIQSALICWQENSKLKFITAAANSERDKEFQDYCQRLAPELPIHFVTGHSHDVMAASDVVLVACGTATLETMLFKRPMVIAYRMANLTYQIARHLVKIPYFGLPNVLAKQEIVPEFIQDNATPNNLAQALLDFLDHPEKMQQIQNIFLDIHQQLRCNANERAAEAVLNLLNKK